MYCLRVFLFVVSFSFALSGFSQTGSGTVDTLRKTDDQSNPRLSAPIDTSATPTVAAKPTVFKDSARLALERLPGIAVRRSAILPGWGQVTNKRWWKVPLIYGGFVGVGLVFEFNQRYYKKFLSEAQFRDAAIRAGNPELTRDPDLVVIRDQQGLIQYKDYYRRTRDLSVLVGLGLYTINIIDAYVDAKFFRFDISDRLGLRVTPSVVPSMSSTFVATAPALKFQIKL
jgi:hypothetical protein